MIKIFHAADLHLNSPFRSLPPQKAAVLRDKQFDVIDYICELCAEENTDIILFAGDVFDSRNMSFDSAVYLKNALSRLSAQVFICAGNHDYYHAASHYASIRFSDNVHVFTRPIMERVDVCGISVYGAGFNSNRCETGILSGFKADNPLSIGVLHGDLNAPSSVYNPISLSDVEQSGLLYLALGHVHSRTEPAVIGRTHYAYSGCAMGRGFDECGVKGGYMIEISDNSDVNIRFVPLPSLRYHDLSVNLGGCREFPDVRQAISSQLPPSPADCIIKLNLTGNPLCKISQTQIDDFMSDICFHCSTRLKLDFSGTGEIWDICGSDTLHGLYMSRLFEIYSKAQSDDEREQALIAAQYAYAAIKNIIADQNGGVMP